MSRRHVLLWSRTDSVILTFVLAVFLALQALHGLFLVVWGLGFVRADSRAGLDLLTRPLPSEASASVTGVVPHGNVTVEGVERMVLVFHDPSVGERLLLVAPALLTTLSIGLVAYLLLRMLPSLREGDPFSAANVRRAYTVALTVITGSLLVPACAGVTGAVLESRALGTDPSLTFTFGLEGGTVPLVLVGLILAALAEIFRRGARLRHDVEGLV